MANVSIIQGVADDERERALTSIAERWHGDLGAYLQALARQKHAAEERQSEEECTRSSVVLSRLARFR